MIDVASFPRAQAQQNVQGVDLTVALAFETIDTVREIILKQGLTLSTLRFVRIFYILFATHFSGY